MHNLDSPSTRSASSGSAVNNSWDEDEIAAIVRTTKASKKRLLNKHMKSCKAAMACLCCGRGQSSVQTSLLSIVGVMIVLWLGLSIHLGSKLQSTNSTLLGNNYALSLQDSSRRKSQSGVQDVRQFSNHSLPMIQGFRQSVLNDSMNSSPLDVPTIKPKPAVTSTAIQEETYSFKQYSCKAGNITLTFPQAPDFILAGAQKSGTTALSALLEKHPFIVRSSNFEEHWFDMHHGAALEGLERKFPDESTDSLYCRLGRLYADRLSFENDVQSESEDDDSSKREEDRSSSQQSSTLGENATQQTIPLTFEKTPYYLFWEHIPRAIEKTCPWQPKIIVMLRNPVDRLYSHYQMRFLMRPNSTKPLESILNEELALMHRFGLSKAPFLSNSEANSSKSALAPEHFHPPSVNRSDQDRLDSIRFRGFGNHRQHQRYLQRGIYVTQLVRWFDHFRVGEDLLILQYEQFKKDPRRSYNRVLEFLGVESSSDGAGFGFTLPEKVFRATYRSDVEFEYLKTNSQAPPMKLLTKEYLQEFYQPYNEQLSRLLGDDELWLWKNE